MHFLIVPKEKGERIRKALIEDGILVSGYRITAKDDFLFFPISVDEWREYQVIELEGEPLPGKSRDLREVISGKLTDGEIEMLVTSYDVVGDIIIIEIPPGLEKKEGIIADALLEVNPNSNVVVKKLGPMEGEYRLRRMEVIGGGDRTWTEHREHGCRMRLDISKVYFSVRLSTERKRIAELVRHGERVLALFAGVGPFPLVINRYQPDCRIIAIELNPDAVRYMKENVLLNRCDENITPIQGDAREIVLSSFQDYADRLIMPLPKSAEDFLDVAIAGIRNNGIIHFYTFDSEGTVFPEARRKMQKAAERAGVDAHIVNRRVVRSYAPGVVQVVLDVRISK